MILRRHVQCVQRAYVNGLVAACSDDDFLSCRRLVQFLCMLLCPIQQWIVATAVGVVLLSCINLHQEPALLIIIISVCTVCWKAGEMVKEAKHGARAQLQCKSGLKTHKAMVALFVAGLATA